MKILNLTIIAALLFFAASCKSGGTKKTPSGYSYTMKSLGSGPAAKVEDFVSFGIKLVGNDGKVIQEINDSTNYPNMMIPKEFAKGKEANPIVEALLGAKVGDSIIMIYPIDSFPQAPMELQALKYIEYRICVKKIQSKAEADAASKKLEEERNLAIQANAAKMPAIEELVKTTLADYKSKKLEVKSTASGLKYYIVKEGAGPNVTPGQTATVQYYGCLLNGKKFDDSFSRGAAFPFSVGAQQVIKGWDEGFTLFNKGTKAFLFVPGNLAYGEQGQPQGGIGPNEELVFYVELEDIK